MRKRDKIKEKNVIKRRVTIVDKKCVQKDPKKTTNNWMIIIITENR